MNEVIMKTARRTLNKSQQLQEIVNAYMEASGKDEIDMSAAAEWAMKQGLWNPPRFDPVKACARDLSRAAREEFYHDPQGREVRKKHCYTIVGPDGQRQWLWFDIVNAAREQMHTSAQARRKMALGDVVQLKKDVGSWNDNNKLGGHIQMSFNFDEDLAELAHPTVYPGDEEDAEIEIDD